MIQPHGVGEDGVAVVGGAVVVVSGSVVVVEGSEVRGGASVDLVGVSVVVVDCTVVAVVGVSRVVVVDGRVVVGGGVVAVATVVVAIAGRSVLVDGIDVGSVTEGASVVVEERPPPPPGVVREVLGRLTEGSPDPEPPHAARVIPAAKAAARAILTRPMRFDRAPVRGGSTHPPFSTTRRLAPKFRSVKRPSITRYQLREWRPLSTGSSV